MKLGCFALIWSDTPRQEMIDAVDAIPEIVNWKAASGAIFIVTEKDAKWVSEKLRLKFSTSFMIVPVRGHEVEGYQVKETWTFINKPKAVGTKDP